MVTDMTKKQLQTVVNVFKKVSNQYGINEQMVRHDNDKRVYIDGDIFDFYWNYGTGWDFRNTLDKELEKRGLWLEPEYGTIFLVNEN